jgi:small subunit ribosomal protein S17
VAEKDEEKQVEKEQAEETPAEETPAAEAETPAEEAPEEAPTEQAAEVEEAPAEEGPPPEEAPAEEAPAEGEPPAEEAPPDEAPAAEGEDAPAAAPARPAKPKRKPRRERRTRSKPKREQVEGRKPITRLPKPEGERGRRVERRGVVVSSAMDKTIVVRVDTVKAHPRYKKVVRRSAKFHAHDEQNAANVGDVVLIVETRPLSKTKNWRLSEVLEVAK